MTRSTVGFFIIVVIFIAVVLLALRPWNKMQSLAGLPVWRRVAFGLGVAALMTQGIIFAFVYTRVGEDHILFPKWLRLMFPLFWVSVAGIVAGKGSARWALLAVSVALLALSYLTVLSI